MLTGRDEIIRTVTALEQNRQLFQAMLRGFDEHTVNWKPDLDQWCLLEVVCHLYDEELEDFRARVKHLLDHPERPLTPIDPAGWVTERRYIDQNYQEMVGKFLVARNKSVIWLKSLDSPAWNNSLQHPDLGNMSARKFLVNWLAHDYHHIRQINRLSYQYHKYHSSDDLSYAGKW